MLTDHRDQWCESVRSDQAGDDGEGPGERKPLPSAH